MPTSPSRAVVIDVDATAGALVVTTTERHVGEELEISPIAEPSKRSHVWVLPREGRQGLVYAAVFARLPVDDYVILTQDGSTQQTVSIRANEVTFASWGAD